MNVRNKLIPILLSVAGVIVAAALWLNPSVPAAGAHGHEEGPAEAPRGPHRGRLLVDGDFTLELAIFEAGVPPEFRAWFTRAGKPVPPADVKLSVTLIRPGKSGERFAFVPAGDFLRGDHVVDEPHSFDYQIVAEHAGVPHRWAFAAPEMQTVIAAAAAEKAGVRTERAGAARLAEDVMLYGRVAFEPDGLRRASARFAGVVIEARRSLGDKVESGEILARLENSQSLVTADVRSPGPGIVVARPFVIGEAVPEGALLYSVADLSKVWIELEVPRRDLGRVRVGQAVVLAAEAGGEPVAGRIASFAPAVSAETQSAIARVVLPNPAGLWRPGAFVKATVTVGEVSAPVTVRLAGLQTLFDRPVVFSRHGEVYQARPLRLGRRGGGRAEVLEGLEAGEEYVTEGSFLIKADIGKAGASHDH
jgi:cobalt-zinc-cadmium efflux system membrane fusion protein